MATTQVIYSDIPVNFDVHPLKGDLIPTTNEDAVKRSIKGDGTHCLYKVHEQEHACM